MQDIILDEININGKIYNLSSKIRIFFAGFLDILFSSVPSIILGIVFYFVSKNNPHLNIYVIPSVLIVIGFLWLVFYFIVIPIIFNGRTLCKILFGLKLYKKNNEKIQIKHIILRELIIIFIPWFIGIFSNLLSVVIYKVNIMDTNTDSKNMLIFRLTTTFYFVWYLFIFLGIWIDKRNQLFFDYKFNIYILKFVKIYNPNAEKETPITKNKNHIHLQNNQPGNFDEEVIKELENIESNRGGK